MSQPYVGEIRMFAGNFGPSGWLICDGSLLAISENETLFNLIGTTYGGDGQSTFALPDLRGRVPLHLGSNYPIGQLGGVESVTLLTQQLPSHTHPAAASSLSGNLDSPAGAAAWAAMSTPLYSTSPPNSQMNAGAVGANGGNQPHDNMMPYLTINFIISLYGIYPSPS
jgi:microcystin-dependent protein